jgi:hypothetical protein
MSLTKAPDWRSASIPRDYSTDYGAGPSPCDTATMARRAVLDDR